MRFAGIVAIVSMLAISALAGSGRVEKATDLKETQQDRKALSQTEITLDLLSHTVDLWHDAGLKGSRKGVQFHEREIEDLLKQDIEGTPSELSQAGDEADRSLAEDRDPRQNRAGKIENRKDLRDDRKDVKEVSSYLAVKKQLASSFNRSTQFSNKYRLINDYLAVLKLELKSERLELVEGVAEYRER